MEREKPHYEFSSEKNQKLVSERGISFEEVIEAIENGLVVDVLPHQNPEKYTNQEIYVLNINDYVYLVPFVRKDKNTVFLKTIFPHRKLTKQYLKGGNYEK
jgi:uncharacterized DUF497 family protein